MFQAIGMGNNFYMNGLGKQSTCYANFNTQYCNTAVAANMGFNYGYKIGMTYRVQNLLQNMAGNIGQLTQALQNPNLTADEKNKIKEHIESLQKLVQKVQSGLESLPTPDQMAQVEKAAAIATQNAMTNAQEIIQKHSAGADEVAEAGADEVAEAGADEVVGSNDGKGEVSEEAAKKAKEEQDKQKTEALDIINGMYQATEGYSQWYNPDNDIDYPKLREAAKKINKDNIANIIVYWEEQFGSAKGKSIIKALFDGEHGWNPSLHGKDQNIKNSYDNANNMDILWNMTICLKEKAKELGVYNDLAGQFTVAFDELDDTNVDEEVVDNALKAIAAAVYTKQTEKLAESAQEDTDATTKTYNKNEADKRRPEVEAQKKQEFQNALRKAYDLGAKLPELVAGFKVITDDNGEFKECAVTIKGYTPFNGSSFENIIAQLKEYGIDPKKALIKKVDTKA